MVLVIFYHTIPIHFSKWLISLVNVTSSPVVDCHIQWPTTMVYNHLLSGMTLQEALRMKKSQEIPGVLFQNDRIPKIFPKEPIKFIYGGFLNGGTSKSSIFIGFSIINHTFYLGYPHLWKPLRSIRAFSSRLIEEWLWAQSRGGFDAVATHPGRAPAVVHVAVIFRWVCWTSVLRGFTLGFTIWLFNIAMENGPCIDGLPIKNGDFPWLC